MALEAQENPFPYVTVLESAADGSEIADNPAADYRKLFLGEDGLLYTKDSAGTVAAAGGAAAHIADTSDAHDASAISFTPNGSIAATDVQAAIQEVRDEATSGSVATDAIWDAAGDLAVGSGANTAAKLSLGNAGAHLSRINGAVAWDAGTSNPTGVDNDRYFRTDILNGVPIVYDGTRWLTQQIFVARGSVTGASASGGGEQYIAPYGGTDLWLIDFGWAYNITPTHSGTQFWDLVLHKYEATGATDTTLVTLVSDKSSTIWVNPAATSIGALLGTTIDLLYVTTVKHSTPSNLTCAWRLRYQVVVT